MPVEAKRAQAIFLAAVEVTDPAARTVILDRECGDDPELRQRVEALLRAYSDPDSMLDAAPIVEAPSPESEVTQAIDSATPQSGDAPSVNDKLRDLGFLKPATKPDSIGRIDQYEILEVIGQGGFGTVFKAFDDKLHRVVAIKVLSPAYAANGAARKRFIREARTAAAIKNEHVVAIYDVDEDAQPPYLAMEMIDGVSLQDKLDKRGPLGLKEILRIGLQMAEGLAAAHKQSLVHRDIKPANILLENGVERVKITDFGLARAVDDASVTQSGTVAGTPMYMSPEQAEGAPIDHRSDLFSLGTVLYAMCTGHPPFRATGTHAVLKRVIDASPRPIREINDDIPQWLCDIIGKLHAKKPEDRYASAKDVAEVLGARLADVQAGRAIEQRTPASRQPAVRSRNRRIAAAVFACLGVVLAVSAVVAFSIPAHRLRAGPKWLIVALAFAAFIGSAFLGLSPTWWRRGVLMLLFLGLGISTSAALTKIFHKPDVEGEMVISTGALHVLNDNQPGVDYFIKEKAGDLIFDTRWVLNNLDGFALGMDPEKKPYYARVKNRDFTAFTLPAGISYELFALKDSKWYHRESFVVEPGPPTTIRIPPPPAAESGWVQLFNGKDLTGWGVPFGNGEWKVVAGVLTGAAQHGEYGILPTLRDYGNFHLRTQVRLTGPGNSGIVFRTEAGYEAEIDTATTGSIARAKPFAWLERKQHTLVKPGSWCDLELIADGPTLTTKVNGQVVASVTDDGVLRGCVGLQVDGRNNGAVVVEFRKIEIKELPPDQPGWVQLFNGKDLTGWKTHPSQPGASWRVENGLLVASGQGVSHLFSERGDFENFHFRAEVQINRTGNSGIYFRSPFSLGGNGFPAALEAQIQNGDKGDWKDNQQTGSLSDLRPFLKQLVKNEDWFSYEIIAHGNQITLKVNGITTVDTYLSEKEVRDYKLARRGHFILQKIGEQTTVRFRKIEIKELPPDEPGWVQLFNGKDLTGWKLNPADKDVWRVKEGILVGQGAEYSMLPSERGDFRDFHLRVEAMINEGGDSGVWFRTDLKSQDGYEANINHSHRDPARTGSLGIKMNHKQKWLHHQNKSPAPANTWFTLEVIAVGPNMTVKIDGVTVAQVTNANRSTGHFGLEMFEKGSVAHFRKIEIKELPPNAPGWVQLFNLEAWQSSDKWQVKNGILVATGPAFLVSKHSYRDFQCRLTARYNKEAVASISFRGRPFETHGEVAINKHAMGMKTGSFHFFSKAKSEWVTKWNQELVTAGDWFDLELVVRGKHVIAMVNGTTTANVPYDGLLDEGFISLNAYEPGTMLEFKKIEIKELPPEEPGWVQLFNGKDLTGWKNHPDQPGEWKVVKEVLVGKGRMGLLYSERGDYADYDLRIEAKVNKGGYGGVYVRTPDFPAIRRQVFDDPKGHRVVMSAASKLEPAFNTGSLKTWTPKGHLVQAFPTETPPDEWFTLEILTRGPEIFVRVNGKKTAQLGKVAEKSHEVSLKGHLVLEAAGDDTVIHIRKIEIKEHAPSP